MKSYDNSHWLLLRGPWWGKRHVLVLVAVWSSVIVLMAEKCQTSFHWVFHWQRENTWESAETPPVTCFEHKPFLLVFCSESDNSFTKYRSDWRALKLTDSLYRTFSLLSSGKRWRRSGVIKGSSLFLQLFLFLPKLPLHKTFAHFCLCVILWSV